MQIDLFLQENDTSTYLRSRLTALLSQFAQKTFVIPVSSRPMRLIYTSLFYLAIPLILLRLAWRSIKLPAYRLRIGERLGFYALEYPQVDLWLHAVSVGEAEAAFPLIKLLQQQLPEIKILVTTTTPTGSSRVQTVLADTVTTVYLPYDLPWVIRRFLNTFKPKLAVIMETEIWPNLFNFCDAQNVSLFIVNARLSAKSARGYTKILGLIKPTLSHAFIAAQTQADAERFVAIGAKQENVQAIGNIKFDLEVGNDLLTQGSQIKMELLQNRLVWIVASTHKNEEDVFLKIYPELKSEQPDLLLVIVPRHLERFSEVKKLCLTQGLNVVTRSSGNKIIKETDIFLVDRMGELKLFYAASDLSFVGGSLVPVGGHNVLEPAAVGVPVLFGPYMDNFKEIEQKILSAEAAIQCHDQDDLIREARMLLSDPALRKELKERGLKFMQANRGALGRVSHILLTALKNKEHGKL